MYIVFVRFVQHTDFQLAFIRRPIDIEFEFEPNSQETGVMTVAYTKSSRVIWIDFNARTICFVDTQY